LTTLSTALGMVTFKAQARRRTVTVARLENGGEYIGIPLEKPDKKPGGYGWSYASHDPRPTPLFFPGLRGRAAGGHPRSPRPSPGRGKTTQPLALPLKGVTALFAADGVDECPGMGMNHAPHPEAGNRRFLRRRVGVPLARPLTGRISKGHDKGCSE
jgi:hypothetical protein